MFLSGKSTQAIADTLADENIEIPGKSFTFSNHMIQGILRNEKYCGDCILQKTVTVDCISKKRKANEGEAPMYIVENCHPAIISRTIFNRTQEELSRRGTIKPKSGKRTFTASGHHSKYALTDILKCGECGTSYRRVTWTIKGTHRVVWRCISRLDYGKKYCTDSVTVPEEALQAAVVRALKQFNHENEATYLSLMKATIGEAIGLNGGTEEIDLLSRRIDALNKRMLALVNDTVSSGGDMESCEEEFKDISDQIEELNKRIDAIRAASVNDGSYEERLAEIQGIINERANHEDEYDDSIVRQMIECIKVYKGGRLTIIFGGGYEVEETL